MRTEWTYSLRTLVCKWSGLLYHWPLDYDYEILWILWYVILLYLNRHMLLTGFSLVCRTLDIEDAKASLKPIGIWIELGRGLLGFNVIDMTHVHMIRCYDDWLYFWHDSLMMQANDSLLTRLTCGVEGSCTTTRDIEGEVWTTTLPYPTRLSSWLEM